MSSSAGWYSDPTNGRALRWWSGSSWTDQVATNSQANPVVRASTATGPQASGFPAFGAMRPTPVIHPAGFDDVLMGDMPAVRSAEVFDDPEPDARRRHTVAITLATVGVLLVVIAASVYGVAFLQGLSHGLAPR